MHVVLRGEYVIHAPDHEGHVAILLQRNKHAGIVTMLLQLDSFDFHVLGQAVDWMIGLPECQVVGERLR
jgi:hypothetical protein